MTIPPYSKWELPVEESNLHAIKKLPEFRTSVGTHAITPFQNPETVEFVIPYSYDYSMAQWSTCRNRLYVNNIEVTNIDVTQPLSSTLPYLTDANQYKVAHPNGKADYTEANRIDKINWRKYKSHKTLVLIGDIIAGPFTFFATWIWLGSSPACYNASHIPPIYGDGR